MIFAANRDELHERPTAEAEWWPDHPNILGGRDLLAGGSWLAVDQRGRLAAVTNVRSPRGETFRASRGHLVTDYLAREEPVDDFLAELKSRHQEYGPFNLVIFDGERFTYASNRAPSQSLSPGTYAVSNDPLGSPWPKVEFARDSLERSLGAPEPSGALFEMLESRQAHGPVAEGKPPDRHRSTVFIEDERYGTRSSTVILLGTDGDLRFIERRFSRRGSAAGESEYHFKLSPENGPRARD